MSDGDRTDASARLAEVLQTVDDEIEDIATWGGITADTRGDLSVETLLRIIRWRSGQTYPLQRLG